MRRFTTIMGVLCLVACFGLSTAAAKDAGGRDVLRLGDTRLIDGEFYVSVEVINTHKLAGMDIPLRFGGVEDPITLERVEWADRVTGWDFTHASIDNENKTVILGLFSELLGVRPDADLKVAARGDRKIADLVFRAPEGYEATFATFSTRRPTHELTFIHNRYENGVPHVEAYRPRFESDVDFKAAVLPTAFALSQNYPNPFNPSTSFALDLPTASDYSVQIFNVAGQLVKSFNGHAQAGTVTIVWDGTNEQSTKVASGVYFYRADAASFSQTRKMMMVK